MQDIRLQNPQQVRRLLNRKINQLLKDEIETGKARCIGYLSSILLKSIEVEELETRILKLEEVADNPKKQYSRKY
ncbi:hypothetical protein Amet_0962 [Alkaliphilus metalliredigens QYMF]|uniref:Uncharacterized protein n=1 Tax=Alkaliphilus metalliredigens (strain QYMF) TaxID=293826 RepID=A6TLW2_ALKMQ|nr:hypothetical protein [Alkaliphilus metalliredigens]ABR47180.1 hypothetical protein Amet_0962 [Alkaliphilus metalliredigens QYMF]